MRGNGTFAAGQIDPQSAEIGDRRASGEAAGPRPGRVTFAISERQLDERTAVLGVEGELDLASAPQLKWALADMLGAGVTQLVLDLSLVSFIDSTALGVLVGTHRSLAAGERLAIACSHPDVLNIFELTGLDATFDIFSTFDDALAYARGGAVAAD
jgi:anti-sigma B factor antagonist